MHREKGESMEHLEEHTLEVIYGQKGDGINH